MDVAVLRRRLDELADDVGRARRWVDPETSLAWRLTRIAEHIESVVLMVEPSAAEIARMWSPADDQAVDEAIRVVGQKQRRLRERLGYPQDRL